METIMTDMMLVALAYAAGFVMLIVLLNVK